MTDTARSSTTSSAPTNRWWGHVTVLSFGTFAVGADAFVIAGLLPEISRTLSVDTAAAGQLVSVFSIAYAVLSPVLASLTGHWSRRTVLVTALSLFAVGNVLTAVVPDYGLVLAARVLAAAGAAMYTPHASASAATLAGPEQRGRAIAIVTVGLTAALALGAPLGTAIGDVWGWRATMWFVTALAMVAVPLMAFSLPDIRLDAVRLRDRLAPLRDASMLRVLAGTLLAFIGIYLPYTYISAVFGPSLHGDDSRVALLLLVFGLAGTAGNLMAGKLSDQLGPRRVVAAATIGLAVVFLLMLPLRDSFGASIPLVALAGVGSWSVTVPQQHRAIELSATGAGPLAVSLNAATLYLAVSVSGAIGAVGLAVFESVAVLLSTAVVFVVLAAVLTVLSGRSEQRAIDQKRVMATAAE